MLSSLCVSYVNTRKSSRNRGETTYNIEEELTETQLGLEIPYCASKIAKAQKKTVISADSYDVKRDLTRHEALFGPIYPSCH